MVHSKYMRVKKDQLHVCGTMVKTSDESTMAQVKYIGQNKFVISFIIGLIEDLLAQGVIKIKEIKTYRHTAKYLLLCWGANFFKSAASIFFLFLALNLPSPSSSIGGRSYQIEFL